MNDAQKGKDKPIKEKEEVREKIAALRMSETECERAKEELQRYHNSLQSVVKEQTGALVRANSQRRGKIVDEELVEPDKLFREVFERASDGILLADIRAKKFVYGNPAISQMLGYDLDEIRTLCIADIHRKRDLPWILDRFGKLAQVETSSYDGVPVQRKDGSIFYAGISSYRIQMGGKTYAAGVFRDVTRRMQVEEELRKSEARFRAIFDNTTDGIFLLDLRAREFSICNATCATMLDYTQEEFLNLDVADIHPKEVLPFVYEQIGKFSRGEEGIRSDIRFKRKDGSIFVADLSPALVTIAGKEYLIISFKDITERKRAEEALRASEQRFRALVETTSDFVWEVDQNCLYTYASPRIKDLLGYEPEEVIGKTPFDLMPPDEAEWLAKLFRDIAKSGKPFANLENTNLHKDGRRVVLETSGVPIFDARGNPAGYRGIDRDITERKRAEKSLWEKDRAIESTIAGIAMCDLEGTVTYANTALLKLLGCASKDEVLGRNVADFWDSSEKIRQFLKAAKDGAGQIGESTARRKDGSTFEADVSVNRVVDKTGKPSSLLVAFLDITARKQAEENYRSIFQNAVVGIYQSTPEGQFLAVNPAFARIFGYKSPEQIIDMGKFATRQLYVRSEQRRAFQQLMEQHGQVEGLRSEAYCRDSRKIWIKENARAVRDGKGRLAYYEGFVRDITVEKEAEEALKQAARRVIEAQEAERKRVARGLHDSVSQLLSSARFRLTSVGKKIFDQTQKSYPELDYSLGLIEKALQEVRMIIHNLRPAVLDDLGLLAAVRSLCEEFRGRADIKLKFRSTLGSTRLASEIELALFRIVQEALHNIETHSRATRVSVTLLQERGELELKVKDNGIGFDQLAASKNRTKLSGYGLPIMRERAASIEGEVEILSAVGKGTEVIVRIPLNRSRRCD